MNKKDALSSIHFPSRPGSWLQLSPWQRLIFVGIGFCLVCGFLLAAFLEPSTRGYGTHQQLGLPPCTFRFILGIPCPSCGMTTSFSHFVRGQFAASMHANWAGFILACYCLLLIPWSLASALISKAILIRNLWRAYFWSLIVLCGIAVLHWITMLL